MNILFVSGVTVQYSSGGSEVQLRNIALALRKRGHRVLFATIQQPPFDTTEIEDEMPVYHCPYIGSSPRSTFRVAAKLKEIIRDEKIDLLFSRTLDATWAITMAARAMKIPAVYQYAHFFRRDFFSIGQLFHGRFRRNPLNAYMCGRALSRMTVLLTLCREDAEALEKIFHRPVGHVYNAHGIQPTIPAKSSPPLIVWLNNLKSVKRPELFLQAVQNMKDLPCRFLMAGRSLSGEYGKKITTMIAQAPNVEYLGEISVEQCNNYLDEASLNVVTSMNEGFGNGNIQGWLRGTPTISTVDRDAIIRTNDIGRYVTSAVELEQEIRTLLKHPEELQKMSERAYIYASKAHNIDCAAESYESIFEQACVDLTKAKKK